MSNKLAVQKWRTNTKTNIVNSLGGKCCKCGYDKFIGALHLHHLDPATKDSTIANLMKNPRKLSIIIEECKKCILLCGNCHCELHGNLWKIDEIHIPEFNQSVFDTKRKPNKCKICNKETYNSKYCSYQCVGKDAYNYKTNWPSDQEMLELKAKMPVTKIADLLNVSDTTIHKRLKKIKHMRPESN